MSYEIDALPLDELMTPVCAATAALTRLDERLARSPVGEGLIARMHMHDAVSALWLEGELVHLEDLVLHDARMDIRTPSHALTRAHAVLRTRRQIASRSPGWAISPQGMQQLLGSSVPDTVAISPKEDAVAADDEDAVNADPIMDDIDAILARTTALLDGISTQAPVKMVRRDPLLYDDDWDEQERLATWRGLFAKTQALPPLLRAAILFDAWHRIEVLQRSSWLGQLFIAAFLRQSEVSTHHLACINQGLRVMRPEERRSNVSLTRIKAFLSAIEKAADLGMKEHDRLLLSREQMSRKLKGRRSNSRLPQLIEMVLSNPLISAAMVEKQLQVTQQGAIKLIQDLGLREITGRGRFRAWAVL